MPPIAGMVSDPASIILPVVKTPTESVVVMVNGIGEPIWVSTPFFSAYTYTMYFPGPNFSITNFRVSFETILSSIRLLLSS